MINMMYIIPASDTISVKSTLETSEHAFWGAFGKVRGIKRDFHAQNDALWRCRRLSFKFKTRSTGLSTDSLSRRQIGHRSRKIWQFYKVLPWEFSILAIVQFGTPK
jgi:hypothetical protein